MVAVGHAAAPEVDEAAQRPVLDDDVGEAVVAVDEHQVLVGRAGGVQLGEQRGGVAAGALLVEVVGVDHTGGVGRGAGQLGMQALAQLVVDLWSAQTLTSAPVRGGSLPYSAPSTDTTGRPPSPRGASRRRG